MLQYLLNTTAIWLISLVLFDVFFRMESYHGYNRFYLLFTFLLGTLLPLWEWQRDSYLISTAGQPFERAIRAKQQIVSAAGNSESGVDWQQILTIIYLAGTVIAAGLLIIDIFKLALFYKTGNKSKQDEWTIIETGKDHAPFSILNTLFVCSIKQYSEDEWTMILAHEKAHTKRLHFADLVLMQLTRIIFWFHPLVYVYNKRILMAHEYQADNAASAQPQVYGRFLMEQALLQASPSITHSFNRSPIKTRIIMLSQRSSAAARSKMLLFIPLVTICVVFFSKNGFSQKFDKNGNVVTYRGNKFEYNPKGQVDTMILVDPVTAQEVVKYIKKDLVPVKMNGTTIYGSYVTGQPTSDPEPYATNGSIPDYLFRNLSKDLNTLPDGTYRLDLTNVVVDLKGKIVYYEYSGLRDNTGKEPLELEKTLPGKIDKLLNNVPTLKPAKMNNNNVTALADAFFPAYKIEVKNHKATISKPR